MADLKHKGFSYEVIIRPQHKNKTNVLKWSNGKQDLKNPHGQEYHTQNF